MSNTLEAILDDLPQSKGDGAGAELVVYAADGAELYRMYATYDRLHLIIEALERIQEHRKQPLGHLTEA